MSDNGHIEPPLDLHDFRIRRAQIVEARRQAREEAVEAGILADEAEHLYLKKRAIRMAYYHGKENTSWSAAEKLAEGDPEVAEQRLERDNQRLFSKAAWSKWEELKDNRAMLNREAQMSEGIEFTGTAA